MRIYSKNLLLIICITFLYVSAQAQPVRAQNGMVVSASSLATDIGVKILQKGGNAIDAAVAVGYALAVTYPNAGNIGGGGFMVIHTAHGKNTTIDFRETAPFKAHEKMFLDSLGNYDPNLSTSGWRSAGVPGTVAGFSYANKKYGTMKLEELIEPAVELAEDGFTLDYRTADLINSFHKDFSAVSSSKKIFTKKDSFKVGDLFVQEDLAHTLELIADEGEEVFYRGEIADKIVEESEKHGGIFSKKDFEEYKVIEREPIIGTYKGHKIISMPPPSSGGIALIEALNILENYHFTKEQWNSSHYLHVLVEIMKRIYADRAEHLGDPAFYNVPVQLLSSKKYAKQLFHSISEEATPISNIHSANINVNYESDETTHYSVADQYGNVVSVTYTLNGNYGNRIVVDGLGFLLNNQMDDFSSKPGSPNQFGLIGSKANSIQPGKRMLSSMTPTIVLKDDKPFLVIGSPGGATIITSVLQVLLNVVDFGMNIYDAISAPRIHNQFLPDEIYYEPFGISEDVKMNLSKRGYKFGPEKILGRVEGILINQKEKIFWGTSDKRGYGKAEGY